MDCKKYCTVQYILPRSWGDDDDDDENLVACRSMAEASTASYITANERDVLHLVIRLRLRSYISVT